LLLYLVFFSVVLLISGLFAAESLLILPVFLRVDCRCFLAVCLLLLCSVFGGCCVLRFLVHNLDYAPHAAIRLRKALGQIVNAPAETLELF